MNMMMNGVQVNERYRLNVLIACEESQVECKAFREAGHNAFSCDIQPCARIGNPDWHILGDVRPYLSGRTSFVTQGGTQLIVPRWDLVVAHPPCTYLCKVSSVQMFHGKEIDRDRLKAMILARDFFFDCMRAQARYVAVENPLPMAIACLPQPDCFVQPYWYGHKYSKKTLYWLKNLPPLLPNATNPDYRCFVHASRGKYRSRTFEGVAKAMVAQWVPYILDDLWRMEGVKV